MTKPNKIPWLMLIMVVVAIGTICWGLLCPVDVILKWKQDLGVRAYLPRVCIPFMVAGFVLLGGFLLNMAAKRAITVTALEKILTLLLAAFVGLGLLEFFTARIRCVEIIKPAAATPPQTNDLTSAHR